MPTIRIIQPNSNAIQPGAEFTQDQLWTLAELCKRLCWADARCLSVDNQEANTMIDATNQLRALLAEAGYRVR